MNRDLRRDETPDIMVLPLNGYPTSSLLNEIHLRMKTENMGELSTESKAVLLEIAEIYQQAEWEPLNFTPENLLDQMKLEFLQANFDKITLEQLEGLIK